MITLTINGKVGQFSAPLSLTALLGMLNSQNKRVAVERNGEIVPRSQYEVTQLADGDQLEVVIAVGGG